VNERLDSGNLSAPLLLNEYRKVEPETVEQVAEPVKSAGCDLDLVT
jgi:hypothetical protein